MKKVLILAYDFPPYNSIGAQRPSSWLKYLPNYNIDITVVTRHWDKCVKSPLDYIKPSSCQQVKSEQISDHSRVIRAPFNPNLRDKILLKFGLNRFVLIRKVLSLLYKYSIFFLKKNDSTASVYNAARNYIRSENVDLIIATGEPFILFKHAKELSKEFKTPWIADYRDCWTNGPVSDNFNPIEHFSNKLMSSIEKNIVDSAILITTPSPTYRDLIQKMHPEKRIEVVYNGHDIYKSLIKQNLTGQKEYFDIAYAGIIYPHQQLEMFLEAVLLFMEELKITQSQLRITFYGLKFYPAMVERLLSYDKRLNNYIAITERLPYDEVIEKLQLADVLLLLTDEGANWLNAKVFDYLALSRPILMVKNDKGILENILNDSEVGFKASSPDEAKEHLKYIYQQYFLKNKPYQEATNSHFFSRKKQAQILSQHLHNIIK